MIDFSTNKSLIIVIFNANGLKIMSQLQNILYNHQIDIALITEINFTQYSNILITRYILLKTNHPDNTAHGEISILISNLRFQPLPLIIYKSSYNLVLPQLGFMIYPG